MAKASTASCATYPISVASQRLGISLSAAYGAARRGEIPTIRIGKRLLVPREPFDRMLRGEKVSP